MIKFLYRKNICKKESDNNILLFKTCKHCHTDLAGLWEYDKNIITCYGTFYDTKYGKFKSGYSVDVYANFSYVQKNLFYVDLNSLVLGVQDSFDRNNLSGIDVDDIEAIKKLAVFGSVWELTKEQIRSYEGEDYELFGEDYYANRYKKCTNIAELSDGDEICNGYYYLDNSTLETYQDYLKCGEYTKILELKKEIDDFKEMKKCPVCGGELSDCFSVKLYISSDNSENEILEICRKNILNKTESIKKEYSKTATENFVSNILKTNAVATNVKDKEICGTNDLKKYVRNLLSVEKIILEITKRLDSIYPKYYLAEKDAFVAEKIRHIEIEQKRNALQKEYEDAINSEFVPTVTLEKIPIKLPYQPIEPIAPIKPILKEPGLFNKKKVATENEIINNRYLEQLENYNKACEKYLSDMEAYKSKVEELKQEQKSKYEELVLKEKEIYQQKIEELKSEIDKRIKSLDCCDVIIETPEKIKFDLLKPEKEEAEELLINAVKLRAELYSCNVIFEKYRDIVSIGMFCEYLESGRCQALVGTEGAYNLYESEIRMNMVVAQLEKVVESLEVIKNNQFLVYSTLQSIESQLSILNDSTSKALKSLANIEVGVDNIDKKSEVIAYNTERTAYYARKNAELTNVLGYMVALS